MKLKLKHFIVENKILKVSRKQIQETEAFKKLNKILQSITLKKTNVLAIENAVNICNYKGFENWEKETNSRQSNIDIIKELTKANK